MLPTKFEKNEVIIFDSSRYDNMMNLIIEAMPKIIATTESFNKSSSQLKTISLDITDLTPIGASKHIAASIDHTRKALKESEINVKKKEIELNKKNNELENAKGFDADLLEVEILEIESQLEDIRAAQRGAIKKLAFLVEQYNAMCEQLGVDIITEEMHEEDEPRYHVIRAMSQALAAARARGGLIDEGNFIYLQDLGINGAAAQRELTAYLEMEQEILNKGVVPTFELQMNWLNAVADKFSGEVKRFAEWKGFNSFVSHALAQPSKLELEKSNVSS